MVIIASDQWSFPTDSGIVLIGRNQPSSLAVEAADYGGHTISFTMFPYQQASYGLEIVAAQATSPIEVANDRCELIARFSSHGTEEAMASLNACGGLEPL